MYTKIRSISALFAAGALAVMTAGGAQAAADWQQEPVPIPSGNILAFASVAPHVTWAAGLQVTSTGGKTERLSPVVLSRDDRTGQGWQRVVTPGDTAASRANAISAHGADDMWVVGDNDSGNPVVYGAPIFTEHWDGHAWKTAPAPVPSDAFAANLLGVSTLNQHDAWAVGAVERVSGNVYTDESMIEHWDGTAWQAVTLPTDPAATYLSSITASGPNDVWAAGSLNRQMVILHFDGKTWTQVPNLPTATGGSEFDTIAADGPNDVWAAGDSGTASGPLVEHFDGHRWTQVAAPGDGEIFAVTKTRCGTAFIGYTRNTGAPYGEVFDGRNWTDLKLPALGVFDAPYGAVANDGTLTVSGAYDTADGVMHPLMVSTSLG
jgi:hypothetical protein